MTTAVTAVDDLTGYQAIPEIERECRRASFAPPPDLTLSEWADQFRMLSSENSPEAGRWHTSRVPYLKEIMDCCSDPDVERLIFMKSARVGATDGLINNLIGFHMHLQPAPIMVVQPTEEDAKGWSKEHLAPMIRDTPALKGKVTESGRRDSGNTIQQKHFPGGFLVAVGSNSASGFRRRSIKILLYDEVDGYGTSARSNSSKNEGDPISLGMKRSQNFWDRFILEASSPTIKGESRIENDYELSDQRRYHVPCPHCGYEQVLKWRNFKYEDNDPTTIHYVCGAISKEGELLEGCGKAIDESKKGWMVERGRWIPKYPGRRIVGFHIWQAYSLLTSWVRIAEEWLEINGDNERLQVFINTVLGETFSEDKEDHDPDSFMARREDYRDEVPVGVGVLTAGVDVQGDRLEYSVWGYGAGEESWLIKHETLWGDPGGADVWEQLDLALFKKKWRHGTGATLHIQCVCVDSGGHNTDEVYRYSARRRKRNVFAIKGVSTPGAAAVGKITKRKGGARLVPLGTEAIKDTLIKSRLKISVAGPKYMHFPMVDQEYFKQLTAEVQKFRYVNKRPVRYWKKRYERNEALDCAVYAYAALALLGPVRDNLGKIADSHQPPPEEPKKKPAKKRKASKWVGRWK